MAMLRIGELLGTEAMSWEEVLLRASLRAEDSIVVVALALLRVAVRPASPSLAAPNWEPGPEPEDGGL